MDRISALFMTKGVRIDLVDCTDLVDFLVVTGKVHYTGTSLYSEHIILSGQIITVCQHNYAGLVLL